MAHTQEWRIVHLNHSYTELGEVFPLDLDFALYLNRPGYCNYGISTSSLMGRRRNVSPKITDYILTRGHESFEPLQGGIHHGVSIDNIDDGLIQVSGEDYLSYLEGRWYPFDPLDLAGGGYVAPLNTDVFTIIEDLLDATLAEPDSLALTYNLGLSGQTTNDFRIELGDTENILAKIEALSKKAPGFDFEITPDRVFKAYPGGKGSDRGYVFQQGHNLNIAGYSNYGPKGTHTLGVVQNTSNRIARTYTAAAAAHYRRWDEQSELSIQSSDAALVQSLVDAEGARNLAPNIEFTGKYIQVNEEEHIWDEVALGDTVRVKADLVWDQIDEKFRIIGIQCQTDNEGNEEITFTFDDGTLSQ